jgi:cytochrome P450
MELVDDLATPLPVTVIAEILGVEAERRQDFKRWSNAMVGGTGRAQTFDDVTRRGKDAEEFRSYFAEAIEERRKAPRQDLISALIAADEQDHRLNADEIVAFTMLLLVAGNETTTNLIGNAMEALLEHPAEMRKVIEEPSLIPNMVEEALRYDAPVQFLFRVAMEGTELGGTEISKGHIVVPMFASANRDERRYPDAARFDVSRNAQGHLAFGLGPHFCLGAPLARLEARVAFEELFSRTSAIERAGEARRIDSIFLRGMKSLPVQFMPADGRAVPA